MIHRLPLIVIGWLRALLARDRVDRELDDELRYFLEVQEQRLIAAGVSPKEARRRARLELGGLEQAKEACRESWGTTVVEDLARDIRQGFRALGRSPVFTAISLLTLGFGIGASTAMFSQINAVFLAGLPMRDAGELRLVDWTSMAPDEPRRYSASDRLSYPAYMTLRDQGDAFSGVACWSGAVVNSGSEERLEAHVVSGNYFETLGARALLGRTLTDADEHAGTRTAVISYDLWQRAFQGRRSVTSEVMFVNREATAIVGVMPPRFIGLNPARTAEIYLPLSMYSSARFDAAAPRRLDNARDWSACEVVARIKKGVSEDAAREQADRIVAAVPFSSDRGSGPLLPAAGVQPHAHEARRVRLIPAARGTDDLREDTSQALAVLMAATLTVLLIACANVAGLLLARVPTRAREVGTRLALGASRHRVARQLVIEGFVLAASAGALGLVLAYQLNLRLPGLLGRFVSGGAEVARVEAVTDVRVLLFAIGVSALSAMAFSLAPAIWATRVSLSGIIKQAPPPAGTPRRVAGGNVLIAAQVALALLMLIGAGLLLRTLVNLRAADETLAAHTLHFGASPGLSGYREDKLRAWFKDVVISLESVPSVVATTGVGAGNLCVDRGSREEFVPTDAVAPGMFLATGVNVVAGRAFTWNDDETHPLVAIANAAFVREYFGDKNAVGRSVALCGILKPRTIVGVVNDSAADLRGGIRPTLYIPFMQPPPPLTGNVIAFTVRTTQSPESILPAVRDAVASVDLEVPIFDVETGPARRDRAMTPDRLLTAFVTLYSTVALVLACLGLYGVLAYTVSRRTAEVGVRVALGARRLDVITMVLRDSIAPVGTGMIIGVVAALILTRWLKTVLFEVSPNDPLTIIGAVLLFLVTAGTAALVPALRAARIGPMRALRFE